MADDKVTFLTEVELPPYCFMSEAIEWVAYGRVPRMYHHLEEKTDEVIDYRFYWREMPDNFQPPDDYPWFDRLEFESLEIPMPDGYHEAAEKCFAEDVSDLPRRISEYQDKTEIHIAQDDGSLLSFYASMVEQYKETLAELGPLQAFVDEVEASFSPHFDVACAKLFQLLALKRITAEAIDFERWDRLVQSDQYEDAAKFVSVPSDAFSLAMEWNENEILVDGVKHVSLRLKTQDILDNRAMLLRTGKSITVERFGAFYASSNTGRTVQKSTRGRKTMISWQRLKDHLSEMVLKRAIPEGKENCIYELIAFAERELGKSPSRSAVQRNLGSELDAIYAR